MPRVHPFQTNFTSGEETPRLDGRVDFGKYFNGCSRLENFIVHPQGGATRRPGSHFANEVKISSKRTRLIPFRFSVTQAYVLEFGDLYTRFFLNGGRLENPPGTPVEVVTPYLEADLFAIHFAQSADVLFLAHGSYPPQTLSRFSATLWRIRPMSLVRPPTLEYGHRPTATVTPSATGPGSGITLTAAAASFEATDLGREVHVTGGASLGARCSIDSFTSQTVVTVTVLEAFADTNPVPAGSWVIRGSPNTTVTPSAKEPIGGPCTLTLAGAGWRTGDAGKWVKINGGVVQLGIPSSSTVTPGTILSVLNGVTAAVYPGLTLEEAAWSALNGYPATVSFHQSRLLFGGTLAQPSTWWASKTADFFNFATGSFDDDALSETLSTPEMNTIRWFSPSGDLLIGTGGNELQITGTNDAPLTPANVTARPQTNWGSGTVRPIRTDFSTLFLTRTGKKLREMSFDFATNVYRAPDLHVLAEHLTRRFAITDLTYQQNPDSVVWAIRSDGNLLGLTYLREHEVVAWHQHPTDGVWESVAVIPSSDALRDELWVVCQRTIGGVTKRYVEYFDATWDLYGGQGLGLHVDSGLTYDGTKAIALTLSAVSGGAITITAASAVFGSGDVGKRIYQISGAGRATITAFSSSTVVTASVEVIFPSTSVAASDWRLAATIFGGLAHLEGKTVDINGDGAVYPTAVVVGGSVTINGPAAGLAEIGLAYTPKLRTMRPEVPIAGTSQGLKRSWARIMARLYETLGATVAGQQVPFRKAGDPMDQPPPLFSGDVEIQNLGWDTDGRILITQTQPLPITVLFISGTLALGE